MPLKKIGKAIGKVVKKVVPKEIAGIMQVAAPFTGPAAPFVYAAGAYKQSGRINPMVAASLALPYVGQIKGQGLGGLRYGDLSQYGTLGQDVLTTRDLLGLRGATGFRGKAEDFLFGGIEPGKVGRMDSPADVKTAMEAQISAPKKFQGILGKGGDFDLVGSKLLSKKDGSLSYTKVAAAAAAGLSLTQTQAKIEEEADEAGLSSGELSRLQQEAAEMWEDFDTTAFKPNVKDGGLMRVNLAMGSKGEGDELPPDPTTPVNPFKPKPIGPVLPNKKMAEFDIGEYFELFEEANPQFKGMDRNSDEYRFYFNDYWQGLANKKQEGDTMMAEAVDVDILRQMFMEALKNGEIPPGTDFDTYKDMMMTLMSKTQAKKGGLMRTNYALGTKPTSEESGLGGLPIEADMRYSGGFMPYGAKEKADDVPARLSKNEFVFTADAVRAAGGGSVQKGAQKMYNTMKQLESMGAMV